MVLTALLAGCKGAINNGHATKIALRSQAWLNYVRYASSLPAHTVLGMPALSPTMSQGNLGKWQVKVGDLVRPGSVLAEIETDKATLAFENQDDGYVAKLLVQDGAKDIPIGQPVCVLVEEEASIPAFKDWVPGKGAGAAPAQKAAAPAPAAQPAAPAPSAGPANHRLGPAVRMLLEESGLSPSQVTPTGPNSIITKGDVLAAIAAGAKPAAKPAAAAPTAAAPAPPPPPKPSAAAAAPPQAPAASPKAAAGGLPAFTDTPNTQMRKVIASRLTASKAGSPALYVAGEARVDALTALRKSLAAQGVALSVNDFVVKAVAAALVQVPEVNVHWDDKAGAPVPFPAVDVAVAVSTPGGLITPIVRNASAKSVSQISAEVRALAARARDGKLKPEEYSGGSFTISNLGMYGLSSFSAIINPPQAAILAVGGFQAGTALVGGKPSPVTRITATLSADARAVEGEAAAAFLAALRAGLEAPANLLM
eukprot:CAMPEP_0202858506 /NCGR_PEP_ID=MMETSP1391-20130828/1009_1 /ASSEMBLY_ACC=CAM_ASM_000867 /TAXON_ID=1034604 /ORGANISM="Chlamydomonas leiostraca, Strain SAG 11-49" /LENGTH=480 /DNA_ID=CAMNT_0049537431 /DNA_START=69 /DNA_END=1511 /DNA_ORIENTATION=+